MLGPSRFESFDRLFSETGAESMLRLCERIKHSSMYSEESIDRLLARTHTSRETTAYLNPAPAPAG